MEAQQIDNHLISLLHDLPYFSILSTSLQIRLADHAAALCGCRSTRQMDDINIKDVDDTYCELMSFLQICIYECLNVLEASHEFSSSVKELNESDIEILLENTLYEMTICGCKNIFNENFLI